MLRHLGLRPAPLFPFPAHGGAYLAGNAFKGKRTDERQFFVNRARPLMTATQEKSTAPKCPSNDEVRQSLTDHVASKGEEVRLKYGPHIGWNELLRIMDDRSCVR